MRFNGDNFLFFKNSINYIFIVVQNVLILLGEKVKIQYFYRFHQNVLIFEGEKEKIQYFYKFRQKNFNTKIF